jgi:hypothetical protein
MWGRYWLAMIVGKIKRTWKLISDEGQNFDENFIECMRADRST